MKKLKITFILVLLAVFFLTVPTVLPQEEQAGIEELKKFAPKVFIDCGLCDLDYIRTEITFVNYVRDRQEAQVHVLITTLRTGSGGKEYTIAFIGQREFEGMNDTHKYYSKETDTDDEVREGLAKALRIGLMSYVAKTPIASRVRISYAEAAEEKIVKDKWNFWVFKISGSARFSSEQSYKSRSLSGSFSANRITPDIKIKLSASAYQSKDDFTYDDQVIESTSDSMYISGLFAKSLNDHWSVGALFSAESSTYENIKLVLSPSPAIEYNLFPYSQSTRRQLRFLYKLSFNAVRYREETIFDKTYENLWRESLSVSFDIIEKWGTISASLEGSHYFHDFKKNRLDLFNIVNLRLVKGLNFFVLGGFSLIHDQLSLSKVGLSLEEVLLRRRQLESNFNYFFIAGFSFSFGSIYTNVVNPRFGSSGYSGVSISYD